MQRCRHSGHVFKMCSLDLLESTIQLCLNANDCDDVDNDCQRRSASEESSNCVDDNGMVCGRIESVEYRVFSDDDDGELMMMMARRRKTGGGGFGGLKRQHDGGRTVDGWKLCGVVQRQPFWRTTPQHSADAAHLVPVCG